MEVQNEISAHLQLDFLCVSLIFSTNLKKAPTLAFISCNIKILN